MTLIFWKKNGKTIPKNGSVVSYPSEGLVDATSGRHNANTAIQLPTHIPKKCTETTTSPVGVVGQITLDFESGNEGSNPSRGFPLIHTQRAKPVDEHLEALVVTLQRAILGLEHLDLAAHGDNVGSTNEPINVKTIEIRKTRR